jgi:hypothetical protein
MSFRRDGYVICNYISTIFQRFNLYFLFVCLLCSSCTNMAKLPSPIIPEATAEKTQSVAELHFINGNFESALLEYEQIFETSLSPEDRNLALYGLACTQMMLARSDEQLLEAISNLQRWDASKGSAPFVENRHLLVLALKQQGEFLKEKTEGQLKHEKQKNSVIAYQKKKISLMASTLTKLQKQLEELEAIDETFQEIRNPL